MTKEKYSFEVNAGKALHRLGVNVYPNLPDLAPAIPDGVSHVVFDVDGVILPYGAEEATPEYAEALHAINNSLEHGISLVTLGTRQQVAGLLVHNPSPYQPKFPGVIKEAIHRRGATPEHTLGIGDGLSDMLLYRLTGLGHIGLVKSLGGHRAQAAVRSTIYRAALTAVVWRQESARTPSD